MKKIIVLSVAVMALGISAVIGQNEGKKAGKGQQKGNGDGKRDSTWRHDGGKNHNGNH